jgi:hypothetical protein
MNGDIPTPRDIPPVEEIGGAPDRLSPAFEPDEPPDLIPVGAPDTGAPRKSKTKRGEADESPRRSVRWPLYAAVGCLVLPCVCCLLFACGAAALGASLAAIIDNAKATAAASETVDVDAKTVVTLDVTNRVGNITIKTGTTDQVRVDYTKTGYGLTKAAAEKELDKMTVTVTQPEANHVVVEAVVDKQKDTLFSLADSIDLTITVPPDVAITVQQKVGNVTIQGVTAYQLDVTGETGEIAFDGKLAAQADASFRFDTNVGAITLTLPRDTYAAVNAHTNVGSVNVAPEFAISNESSSKSGAGATWEGTLGSNSEIDPPPLDIEATTGSITLKVQ